MSPNQTIVLITGGNQGLGYEIAKKLAREQPNYTILITSRDPAKGKTAAESITTLATNTRVIPIQLDITSDTSISTCFTHVESTYSRLDILINNAGVSSIPSPTRRAEFTAVFNTNVFSHALVTETFHPLLLKSSVKRVIFMSSDLGSIGNTFDPNYIWYKKVPNVIYKSSKAALNMLGAYYSLEWQEQGIDVYIVNPGFRATNLNGYSEYAGKAEEGATEACKVAVEGGKTGAYTETEGPIPW